MKIIVGQEVIYRESCHEALGRIITYSSWMDAGLEFIIVRPYAEEGTVKVMPKDIVELIDPRPRKFRFRSLFGW